MSMRGSKVADSPLERVVCGNAFAAHDMPGLQALTLEVKGSLDRGTELNVRFVLEASIRGGVNQSMAQEQVEMSSLIHTIICYQPQ